LKDGPEYSSLCKVKPFCNLKKHLYLEFCFAISGTSAAIESVLLFLRNVLLTDKKNRFLVETSDYDKNTS
jgi:hypothetical protein